MTRKYLKIISSVTALLLTICSSNTISLNTSAAVLADYGFENGTDNFTSRGGASVSQSSLKSASGNNSLFVTDRTSSWQGAQTDISSIAKAGETYKISCMVLQDTGTSEQMKMTLQYKDAAGDTQYNQIALEEAESGVWTELANAAYTIPSDASQMFLYIETPENLIDFYIDDLVISGSPSVIKTGDADGNMALNTDDLLCLNSYILNKSSEIEKGGDMNSDLKINAFDSALLKRKFMTTEENPWDSYVETGEQWRMDINKNSLYNMGNTSRLRSKIEKAQNGENVTIGYLGGSITEGVGLSNCYAKRSYEYFANTFGTGNNVSYINAGMSGTSSVVGNLRAENDMLNSNPDIIFIEFSVNDHPEEIYKKAFESLVVKCLSQENEPAVILIINRSKGGYSMQEQMAAIGKNYDLPIISMDNALTSALNAGTITWADYAADDYHPHEKGSQIPADCIAYYYRQAMKTENETAPYSMPDTVVYGNEYSTASIAPVSELQNLNNGSFVFKSPSGRFPYGWTFTKNSSNTPLTFTTSGKGIFVLFKSNQNSSLGVLNVTVNGVSKQIAGNRNYAWGGPDADIAYIQNETGELNVSISMESASTDFEIYGIGVIK